jgi:hypothetical protein
MSDIGTTLSKYSKAVKTGSKMETGQDVEADPANGSYEAGTSPFITKDFGAKDETGLNTGFDKRYVHKDTKPV